MPGPSFRPRAAVPIRGGGIPVPVAAVPVVAAGSQAGFPDLPSAQSCAGSANPGCQRVMISRAANSESSWHRMPVAPSVTRWISR